ncbi:MAG TPA: hypothetical protein VMS22_05130 [Candidatus Eisenbacteria bacterium]|nr:hypothetical protein [Candidatus Eisenbacteria bacterium]
MQRAIVYARAGRIAVAVLLGVGAIALLLLMRAVVLRDDVTPEATVATFAWLTLLPWTLARLLDRAWAGEVDVADGLVVLRRRDRRVEVPVASIAGLLPWRLPLPGPGLGLRLASGRRLAYELRPADLAALVDALEPRGATASPVVVYARGRRARAWYHPVLKFAVFGFAPAAIFFNAHQFIAYGGTFGQYYLEGPGAWLRTLAVFWATMVVYLTAWATLWRIGAEAIVLAAAHAMPVATPGVRRAVEIACWLAYWVGVPAMVALRFLA